MLDWNQCNAVERIAGKVGGAWLFKGTRVPGAALFENLEDGVPATNVTNVSLRYYTRNRSRKTLAQLHIGDYA